MPGTAGPREGRDPDRRTDATGRYDVVFAGPATWAGPKHFIGTAGLDRLAGREAA